MEKKAVIKVISNASIAEGDDLIEITTPGIFRVLEDSFVVEYDETELSGMEGTHTIITINNGNVSLERTGNVITKMNFNIEEDHVSLYNTPYGILDIDISTKDLHIDIDENGGELFINYDMCIADQTALSTSLRMIITIK
ncbi:MAG: DUF1934 domain-containing protein [Clostridium sp.]